MAKIAEKKKGYVIDPISREEYYCPYCGEPDKWKPAVLEPHWTIHKLNSLGDHTPKLKIKDNNEPSS